MNSQKGDMMNDRDCSLMDEHLGMPPYSIERYEIRRTLGNGGMARVMLAYDKIRQEEVALKVPLWQPTAKVEETERRFLREIQAALAVQHENLCAIYDVGIDSGTFFVAMEYIDGCTLTELQEQTGQISENETASLIAAVAGGLAELHRCGIVHRDIKPDNIMVDRQGRPVVLDFGLAKCFEEIEDGVEITSADQRVGTPLFMSPELIMGEAPTPVSDLFSLGVVLWTLLCNRPPFDGHMIEVTSQILAGNYPSPRKYCPDLSVEMEALCMTAIASDPALRIQSMDQFQRELNLLRERSEC